MSGMRLSHWGGARQQSGHLPELRLQGRVLLTTQRCSRSSTREHGRHAVVALSLLISDPTDGEISTCLPVES
jgi:hypothetical protein